MDYKSLIRSSLGLALLVLAAAWASPARAQPVLVEASPAPGAVLTSSPEAVTLTFDRALSEDNAWIAVVGESGERFDRDDARVGPESLFTLTTTLAPLPEGRYIVKYRAASPGSSTILGGQYEFVVNLPAPTLQMISPANGEAFAEGRVPVELQVQFFDFGLYNNRIHLYVDGAFHAELRELATELEGLEPGVHEIAAVLARFDDEELPETARTATIAIAQPDPETEGRILAAAAAPDPGLRLAPWEWAGIVSLTVILLGLGIWLGRAARKPPGASRDNGSAPPPS
jgi:methionine-rich copper-binding protein CopC